MEEQNYEVEILKKCNFLCKLFSRGYCSFSSKDTVYLKNKTKNNAHLSPEFCGNLLKLDPSESNWSIGCLLGVVIGGLKISALLYSSVFTCRQFLSHRYSCSFLDSIVQRKTCLLSKASGFTSWACGFCPSLARWTSEVLEKVLEEIQITEVF